VPLPPRLADSRRFAICKQFLSSNKQMQMLTCFGHCGADCQVCLALLFATVE
jgi:hypothetical protein